jgi:hypothetical protein
VAAVADAASFFGRPRRTGSARTSPRIQAMATTGSMRRNLPISMIGKPFSTSRMMVRLDAPMRAANWGWQRSGG